MVRVEVEVCNICRRPYVPVTTATLTTDDEELQGAFCAEHLESLVSMFRTEQPQEDAPQTSRPKSQPKQQKAPKQRAGRRPASLPVLTEEEAQQLRPKA